MCFSIPTNICYNPSKQLVGHNGMAHKCYRGPLRRACVPGMELNQGGVSPPDTFYKLGVYAMKVKCLTPGGLHIVRRGTDVEVIERELHAEVSRGHSSVGAGKSY